MTVRRVILNSLTRPRLIDLTRLADLTLSASAPRSEILDRISRKSSVSLRSLLDHFTRDELKLACHHLDLDKTGNEKSKLISRITSMVRAADGPAVKKQQPSIHGNESTRKTVTIRSRGTSQFMVGAANMEEPRVVSGTGSPSNGGPAPLAQEQDGVVLNWGGKRTEVNRIVLPFQRIEVVNESRATREAEKGTFLRDFKPDVSADSQEWRNKLIWGDNKYVLGSLLEHFAGKVDLMYIDPPFATGQDFSFHLRVGNNQWLKEPSLIEEKAYRDTWGYGISSYLSMMYERLVLARQLLSERGVIYVHCDPRVNSYLRVILEEIFGSQNFLNEITWQRSTAHNMRTKGYVRSTETILFFAKGDQYTFNEQYTPYTEAQLGRYKKDDDGRLYKAENLTFSTANPSRQFEWRGTRPPPNRSWGASLEQLERWWKEGQILKKRDGSPRMDGLKIFLDDTKGGNPLSTLWDDIARIGNTSGERLDYPTQKPEALLNRIIDVSSNKNDLVMDFFAGSGTTLSCAENLGRRWIGCDLSRWAIQIARKRLLDHAGCRPFEVLNLGKYERQFWQGVTFGGTRGEATVLHQYLKFVLDLYKAEPMVGLVHLHGQRAGRMVHVGAADAPVTLAEIREALDECRKIKQSKLDILGWEWEMGLHDVIEAESKRTGTSLRLLQIPREAMDKRAVDAGDVHFYELAYLEIETETKGREARLKLKNFVIPSPELIPNEVRKKIRRWSDYIDYWAVDFEFNDDTFHNQWQDYRTRAKRDLGLTSDWHDYKKTGRYKVLVKVFDIFGNDTTQLLEAKV